MRLNRYIANCGYCSRRSADELITQNLVTLNGKITKDFAIKIQNGDVVSVNGNIINLPKKARLWLYHKPRGLIVSRVGQMKRKTIFETLPKHMPRVISVGRLDYNTEGLMILTNNGKIAHNMSLPGFVRKYLVRAYLNKKISNFANKIKHIEKGININGIKYGSVKIIPKANKDVNYGNSWFEVELYEGKNREIHNIFNYLGLIVSRLFRLQYGPFKLGDLKSGMTKELEYSQFANMIDL